MIKTARQLKDKIKTMSGGNGMRAQTLIRNYIMERFLERIALSEYKDKFVLKGGMLVASIVGLETRATMDIDTTVRSLNLTLEDATKAVEDISKIEIDDGVSFAISRKENCKNAKKPMRYARTGLESNYSASVADAWVTSTPKCLMDRREISPS